MSRRSNAEILQTEALEMKRKADSRPVADNAWCTCIIASTLMSCTAALLEKLDEMKEGN